jgi:hypothetical protein
MDQVATGNVTGDGAAINVQLGWVPTYVMVSNVTDGDTVDIWHRGMADGTSVSITGAAATRATNGITPYEGTATTRAGFTIGSGISESAKVLCWCAMRDGPGSQR